VRLIATLVRVRTVVNEGSALAASSCSYAQRHGFDDGLQERLLVVPHVLSLAGSVSVCCTGVVGQWRRWHSIHVLLLWRASRISDPMKAAPASTAPLHR
jgi:hypothetical protein